MNTAEIKAKLRVLAELAQADTLYTFDRSIFQKAADCIEALEKECDAAVADIQEAWLCGVCKNRVEGREWLMCQKRCFRNQESGALTCDGFEWRGVITGE